ncbi:hypothetical protein DdX_20479 [Ditylenchus destructor]|uniref:Uncharacterized protein n=1 Tax=Ditylenchus destructor TaxID=166010 RepID=A0AAD4MGJ4_9BILA|nr:hypothetical protein DdX_20479 [Ditylenchus destructor]
MVQQYRHTIQSLLFVVLRHPSLPHHSGRLFSAIFLCMPQCLWTQLYHGQITLDDCDYGIGQDGRKGLAFVVLRQPIRVLLWMMIVGAIMALDRMAEKQESVATVAEWRRMAEKQESVATVAEHYGSNHQRY